MARPNNVAKWKRVSEKEMEVLLSEEKFNNATITAYVRVIIDLGLIEYIDKESGHMIVHWALLRKVLGTDQRATRKFVADCNLQPHRFNYELVRFEEDKHWDLRFIYYKAYWYRDNFLKGQFMPDLGSALLKLLLARDPEASTTCAYEIESDQRFDDSNCSKACVAKSRRELFAGIVTLFDCLEDRKLPTVLLEKLRERFEVYFKDIAYVIHLFS